MSENKTLSTSATKSDAGILKQIHSAIESVKSKPQTSRGVYVISDDDLNNQFKLD